MKFKNDIRYTVIQALKAIGSYAVGVFIVLNFLHLKSPMDFVYSSLAAAIVIFFVYFYPKGITVDSGVISFVKSNSIERINLNLRNVTNVELMDKYYNTLLITTRDGAQYQLHPKDARELESVINSHR